MTGISVRDSAPACNTPGPDASSHSLGAARRAGGPRVAARAASPLSSPTPPASPLTARAAPRSYARNVSGPADQDIRRGRRRQRDRLREVLNDVSTLKRCHNCGWAEANDPHSRAERTGPQIAQRDGVAYWRGVQTCGSIWCCPMCAAKIRNGRSVEISEFAAEWIRRGGQVYMVTLTFPHAVGMPLAALMVLIASAFRSVISGRPWTRLRAEVGITGCIRALEVTHGPNGWHPHLHVLVFCEGPGDRLADLQLYFSERWRKFIVRKGYDPPHELHGVKVVQCYRAGEAGEYIAKTQEGRSPGNEMARADMKAARDGRRVPFEILEAAATGVKADLELWWEYERATFRHQAITWSPALRKLAREWLNAEEKTDEELAAEEVNGEVVVDVSARALPVITCIPGLRAAFLDAVEDGGLAALEVLAVRHGFRVVSGRGDRAPKLYRARSA